MVSEKGRLTEGGGTSDPWIHKSIIHGSNDPWIHGSVEPWIMDPWLQGSMDPCIHGSIDSRIMDPWIHGLWIGGSNDHGSIDHGAMNPCLHPCIPWIPWIHGSWIHLAGPKRLGTRFLGIQGTGGESVGPFVRPSLSCHCRPAWEDNISMDSCGPEWILTYLGTTPPRHWVETNAGLLGQIRMDSDTLGGHVQTSWTVKVCSGIKKVNDII